MSEWDTLIERMVAGKYLRVQSREVGRGARNVRLQSRWEESDEWETERVAEW